MSPPATNPYASQIDSMTRLFLSLANDPPSSSSSTPTSSSSPPLIWEQVAKADAPSVTVYKLQGTDFCFKVVADLHATPETAFDLLADIERRGEWDDLCTDSGVVEVINGATKFQYLTTKGIWPAASRDSLTLAYVTRLPDGRYLNVNQSATHPSYPPRDDEGIVRMEAKIAGQIVGPTPDKTPGMCRVIQVADGDLKGWIPKNVIGYIATKAVPLSFKQLDKILAGLEQRTVSTAIQEAEGAEEGSEAGEVDGLSAVAGANGKKEEGWSAVDGSNAEVITPPIPVPHAVPTPHIHPHAVTTSHVPSHVIAKRQPRVGLLERVRLMLAWCQPYFVTVLFLMKVYKVWKARQERRALGY